MDMKYNRAIIYSTKPLSGKFYYRDIFRLLPSKRRYRNSQFPIKLQYSVKNPSANYPLDMKILKDRRDLEVLEKIHLLSLFSQFYFYDLGRKYMFIKKFSSMNLKDVPRGSIRFYQDLTLNDLSVIEIIFPEQIEEFLDKYYTLESDEKNVFRKAMYLFYIGIKLKNKHPSISFLCLISSIETLAQFDNKEQNKKVKESCSQCHSLETSSWKCKECGNPIWGIGTKFKKFILKYAYMNKQTSSNNKFINKLYSTRSKISHFGAFLDSDLFWDDRQFTVNWHESFLHKDLIAVTRLCLINWLILLGRNS